MMEKSVYLPGIIVGSSFLVVYLCYKILIAPWQVLKQHGIKGPKPIPFLGNYLDFRRVGGIHETLTFYEKMRREYGSVVGFYLGKRMRIIVFDKDILQQIYTTKYELFMDRPKLYYFMPKPYGPKSLASACGQDWKMCRYFTNPITTTDSARKMIPFIQKSVDTLADILGKQADSGKSLDVYSYFSTFTMEVILTVYLGQRKDLQRGESDELAQAAFSFFQSPARKGDLLLVISILSSFPFLEFIITQWVKRTQTAADCRTLYYTMLNVVKERRQRQSSEQDMLQLLLDSSGSSDADGYPTVRPAGIGEHLTDERATQLAIGKLLASFENIANTLGFAAYLLTVNPDVQEKLQAEIDGYFERKPEATLQEATEDIKYLDNVVQEVLRMYPAAPRAAHECIKTTTVNGVTFPKGSNIIIPIYSYQHDPEVWDEPEKFNPDRFNDENKAKRHPLSFVPFSVGPRICPAAKFAVLTTKLALMKVLREFDFERAPETEAHLQVFVATVLNPKNGIYIKLASRN